MSKQMESVSLKDGESIKIETPRGIIQIECGPASPFGWLYDRIETVVKDESTTSITSPGYHSKGQYIKMMKDGVTAVLRQGKTTMSNLLESVWVRDKEQIVVHTPRGLVIICCNNNEDHICVSVTDYTSTSVMSPGYRSKIVALKICKDGNPY